MPYALPHLFDALAGKHDWHGTQRWFTSDARRAPHCRRTVCVRPRTAANWHPKHSSRVTCALPLHRATQERDPREHDALPTAITLSSSDKFHRDTSERYGRRELLSIVHWLLRGLTDKIITNVHEMLAVLCTWVASHNRLNIMKLQQHIIANI